MKLSLQLLLFAAAMITAQLGVTSNAHAQQISVTASADTTVYSNAVNNNGGGHSFGIAGIANNGNRRNMLLLFDLSGITPGATVSSARLDTNISQIGNAGGNFELYQIDTAWGEGNKTGNQGSAATAGEATWNEAAFGTTTWPTPGGTFFAPLLSNASITTVGVNSFSTTANFTTAVQAMVDDPAQNFGFLISSQSPNSAIRIGSREGGAAATLVVDFTPATVIKGDVDMDGDVDFSDIPAFIAVLQAGTFVAEADCDCNTVVDFGDIPAFIAILQGQ